jgi:hypothetical protein
MNLTEQQMICKLLNTIEAVISSDHELSNDELEEYCVIAITASKKYGRKTHMVHYVVDMLEGLPVGMLADAGLDYNDYLAAYHQKAALNNFNNKQNSQGYENNKAITHIRISRLCGY